MNPKDNSEEITEEGYYWFKLAGKWIIGFLTPNHEKSSWLTRGIRIYIPAVELSYTLHDFSEVGEYLGKEPKIQNPKQLEVITS